MATATQAAARAPQTTSRPLRAWQQAALSLYEESSPKDFLVTATPGAGKTTFALRLAKELLARRTIDRITVVAPTEHLKRQWADSADRVGIRIDPMFSVSPAVSVRTTRSPVPVRRMASPPAIVDSPLPPWRMPL